MRALAKVSGLLYLLVLFPVAASAGGTATDFTGNGQSEFLLLSTDKENGGNLIWTAYSPAVAAGQTLGTFGKSGNHTITTDWFGKGIPQIGVATLNDNDKIVWRIPDTATGGEFTRVLGPKGGIVVSGADFNNNGVSDGAVVYQSDGKVMWKIWYDMFTALAPRRSTQRAFGRLGDRFFSANPDGAGDWMGVVRKDTGKKSLILLKNVATNEERSITAPESFALTAKGPYPVKQVDGKDYLVFAISKDSSTTFYQQNLDGTLVEGKTLPVDGTIVVGKFRPTGGEELAIQTDKGFIIYDPLTGKRRTIQAPKGTAADEININQIGGSPDDWSDGNPGGGTPVTGPLAEVCAAYSPVVFPEMFIKSEASGHINDPRCTGYSLMCGTQCPVNVRKADFFYADGTYAGSFAVYSIWGATGKPRMYGAVGAAPQHFADKIAKKARKIGNGKLYLQISRARTGSGTFCKEFAPTGRVGGVKTSYGVAR